MQRLFFSCLLFLIIPGYRLRAQMITHAINPELTQATIRTIHGGHLALRNPSSPARHRLLVMIEGTGATAGQHRYFDSIAAAEGYHVISPDYDNTVITTICSNSSDSSCFDTFRQEIVFGTPVSPVVQVDTANSIVNRIRQLLIWLAAHYPEEGWNEYINGEEIQWQKTVVAGHSQGAGHAAYLGKQFLVARVLIFAGPQDYLSAFQRPANWLSRPGKTEATAWFAFLHSEDPYDFNKQLANCRKLMGLKGAGTTDTLHVQPQTSFITDRHILVATITSPGPHGSMLEPEFRPVWEYLLRF